MLSGAAPDLFNAFTTYSGEFVYQARLVVVL